MIVETIKNVRDGLLSGDDAISALMADGLSVQEAAKLYTGLSTQGQSSEARRLEAIRKENPILADNAAPTYAEQKAFDQKLLDRQAEIDARNENARREHQAIIDALPSSPLQNALHAGLSLVPEAMRLAGQTGQFLTGGALGDDLENLAAGVQADITRDYGTPKLQEQQKLMAETAQRGGVGENLRFLANNPGGAATLSAPSLAVSMAGLTGPSALLGRSLIARGVAAERAGEIASRAANYGNAALNAGQAFAENADEGMNPLQNMIGAIATAAATKVVGDRLGGGAEGMVARRLTNGGPVAGSRVAQVRGALTGAGKGALDELNDNLSIAIGQAISKNERPDIEAAVAGSVPDMIAGGLLGGAGNVGRVEPSSREQALRAFDALANLVQPSPQPTAELERPQQTQPTPQPPVQPQQSPQAQEALQPAPQPSQAQEAPRTEEKTSTSVVERLQKLYPDVQMPPQEQTPAAPRSQETPAETAPIQEVPPAPRSEPTQTEAAPAQASEPVEMVLQNRDRSSDASINQMTKIAANPDYALLSEGKDFANGAPVVAYAPQVEPSHLGRKTYAVTQSHERIPVQFAVMEAEDVITSNRADGTTDVRYSDQTVPGARAIAGNGRIAGLTAAYSRGTAAQYRQELSEDQTIHGIDPKVIARMRHPVLVRIMPNYRVTANIGDVSNTSGNLNLSAVEQAANDVRRLDIPSLKFDDNGNVSTETIRDFAQRMPASEQGNLIDRDGSPTRQAVERFNAAVFKAAFDTDELVRLYAQETDPELKQLLNAMGTTAAKYARLQGCGDLDIRGLVSAAAEMIINAKRSGQPYEDYFANLDLFSGDPSVAEVARNLVANMRSQKRLAEILANAADFAYAEATKSSDDLWGKVPRATRQDAVDRLTGAVSNEREAERNAAEQRRLGEDVEVDRPEREGPQDLEQSAGREASGEDVQRQSYRAADRRDGQTDARSAEEERPADVEAIKSALRNDPQVGEAFSHLEREGRVEIVASEADIPALEDSKESRSAMKSVEANIRRGQKAMAKALLEHTSVFRAMYRNGLGWVDFLWGYEGDPKISSRGVRKGQRGLLHILEARWRKDGYSEEQISSLLDGIVETIAKGSLFKESEFKQLIEHKGVTVVLIKNRPYNNWLLSGYRNYAVGDNVPAFDAHAATTPSPTPGRAREGATANSYEDILGARVLTIKRSEAGEVQGVFDPSSGTAYLVAENLTPETARGVFLHEVGVHMAAESSKDLLPIIRQARVMLNNAYEAGDDLAHRIKQRLADAGEIASPDAAISNDAAEEAMAYLVEEVANREVLHAAWRNWWNRLKAAIKSWLVRHGINVELTADDFAQIALGAASQISESSGRGRVRFSRAGKTEASAPRSSEQPRDEKGRWTVFDRDELGKRRWTQGRMFYDAVAQLAYRVFDRLPADWRFNPNSKELRKQLRAMKAEEDRGIRNAMTAAEIMKEMPLAQRGMVSDVIEGELQTSIVPPREIAETAAFMNAVIEQQSKELVELGMLSKASYERYKGRYLPRFYETKLAQKEQPLLRRLFPASPVRGIYADHLKGRGIFSTAKAEAIPQYVELGWEVRDPVYEWKGGRLINKSGQASMDKEAPDGTPVGIWRDYTKSEREQMGEIRDAGFRFTMGQIETSKALALGRFYKWIATNPELCRNQGSDGFVQVPKVEIPDTGGVLRYGALAGKWVSKEVMSHLTQSDRVESVLSNAYREALSLWKEGKTAMNPVSHFNNCVGNWQAAQFAGVNMLDAKAYVNAMRSLYKHDESYREAEEAGLFTGSFTREEIAQSLPEPFRQYLDAARDDDVLKRAGGIFMQVLTFGLRNKLSKMYGLEDDFFKLVIYQHARKNGQSPADAVDYALQYVFAYDDLPAGARKIRDSILPFFAWTYKAVPMLAKTALYYPWRFFGPSAAMFVINKFGYLASVGAGEGDWLEKVVKAGELEEAERSLMPKYMQGYGITLNPKFLRFGVDKATGLPQYLNLSYASPGANFLDFTNQSGGVPLPEIIAPNHPVTNLMAAMIWNKDTFSGWEVVRETDSPAEKAEKWAAYLWRQASPAIAIGNYHWNRIMNGVAAELGTTVPGGYTGIDRYGNPMPLDVAIKNLAGLKVRTFEPQLEFEKNVREASWNVRTLKSEARSAARQAAVGSVTREAAKEKLDSSIEKIREATSELEKKRQALSTVQRLSK